MKPDVNDIYSLNNALFFDFSRKDVEQLCSVMERVEVKEGEIFIKEGDDSDSIYIIHEGEVEVIKLHSGEIIRLAVLGRDDFFGEMSIFEREVRMATVRALTDVRLLTIDKKTFLRRIQTDPSLAFRIVETMSRRIRKLDTELVRLKAKEISFFSSKADLG